MYEFEQRLRTQLQEVDPVLTVGREHMLVRVAKARRRRAIGTGLFSAAAVLLAVTVALPLVGRLGSDVAGFPPPVQEYVELGNVVFHDRSHGYALHQRCVEQPPISPGVFPGPRCRLRLVTTADGGQSWQERPVPEPIASERDHLDLAQDTTAIFTLRGHSRLMWAPEPGVLAITIGDGRYWTSTDGAQTWRQSPDTYDISPPGMAFAFGSGDEHVFLPKPPSQPNERWISFASPTDNSYWGHCLVASCLLATRDLGKTWQELTPDRGREVRWFGTADGKTVYAAMGLPGVHGEPLTLSRSTDGAGTWQSLGQVPDAWGALALSNGDVILLEAKSKGGVYRLAAGTETAVEIPDVSGDVRAFYVTGGVVVLSPVNTAIHDVLGTTPVAWISTDNGVSFSPVPPPL